MKFHISKSVSFKGLQCKIFGHKLAVSKNVTFHIHEYQCINCGVEMTDTANGFLARLTPKFKDTNNYLAHFYEKRHKNRPERFANAS